MNGRRRNKPVARQPSAEFTGLAALVVAAADAAPESDVLPASDETAALLAELIVALGGDAPADDDGVL